MTQATRYTRARLVEAAEQCGSIDEVIEFFGTRPYENLRRYLLRRFAHYGIDVSHFPRRKHHRVGCDPAPAELHRVVAASTSLADVLRRLDRPDTTGQRSALRRWLAEEGICTAHLLGQAHQRGKESATPRKTADDVLRKHDGTRRTKTVQLRRALHEIGVPERCGICGTVPEWHGRPMTLEVDHVNGDWSDDRAGNLRLLCPNCHAITRTWCRGGQRRSR